ncbi:sensor histidine kinase [Neptuniibacter pectenicola]|uniref:histidine kinase n=1 Tax=Neptuniibacter pectenicola TaxID=1806669 RepID=A0ABU9TR88_9GAMM
MSDATQNSPKPHANEAHIWQSKLNRKRLIFGAGLVALAMLSGVVLYSKLKEERITLLREQHEEKITLAVIDINRELGDIRNTLRLLSTDNGIIDSLSLFNPLNTHKLSTVFSRFGKAVDNLLQIRWLDERGHERVRINIEQGKAETVRESALQNKGDRYYFKNAMKVKPPEIYISPIDLNIEKGAIVWPFQPVFRIGYQTIETYGMRHGLLMINYDLSNLIDKVRSLNTPDAEVMLVDAWGNWLMHPNKKQEWGTLLGQSYNSLKQTEPQLWERIHNEKASTMEPYHGAMISARLIMLSTKAAPAVAENIYMLVRTPDETIDNIKWESLQPALLLMLGILLVGGRILWRDFAMQHNLRQLTHTLAHEKHELKLLNHELDGALSRQQLLQNELVETRKLSSLGMMVAGVAHELNTPIGGAIISTSSLKSGHRSLKTSVEEGLSRQALEDYLTNTEEGLTLVEHNLTRAANLVKSFKRLALDRSNEEVVSFNLAQVVSDLLCSLTPKLKSSGTTIINHIDTELMLTGYPGIVSQILQNLIINAITYGTYGMSHGEIRLDARLDDTWVIMTVSDNGKGVAPELKESLFDPFVTSGRGLGHTGLGLHLVHQWVTRLMHGRITLESPKAGGTAFVIHLPKNVPHSHPSNNGSSPEKVNNSD